MVICKDFQTHCHILIILFWLLTEFLGEFLLQIIQVIQIVLVLLTHFIQIIPNQHFAESN